MSPVLTAHVSQPITLDEQTQKMKRHLLTGSRCQPTFIASIAAAATPVKSKFLPPSHPYSTQNVLALRLFHHRVTPIFCYLLAQSPGRCVCLHFGRMSLPPIIKSVFPTARAVSAAVFSTISTASGAAATPLSPLMFRSPAARQHRPPPFTVSPWRWFAATEDSRGGLSRSHRGDYATAVAADPAITAYRH